MIPQDGLYQYLKGSFFVARKGRRTMCISGNLHGVLTLDCDFAYNKKDSDDRIVAPIAILKWSDWWYSLMQVKHYISKE